MHDDCIGIDIENVNAGDVGLHLDGDFLRVSFRAGKIDGGGEVRGREIVENALGPAYAHIHGVGKLGLLLGEHQIGGQVLHPHGNARDQRGDHGVFPLYGHHPNDDGQDEGQRQGAQPIHPQRPRADRIAVGHIVSSESKRSRRAS